MPFVAAPSLAQAAPAAAAARPAIEPESIEALEKMSAFLATLPALELTSQTSLDLVTKDGQRVQVDGVARYKIRRPDGFVIETVTPLKTRKFIYDGKQFTIAAPALGYYATVPAPPTNSQTLDVLWDRFKIQLPLEDLFRWSDPSKRRREAVQSGFDVGPAVIDGIDTEQYAFREGTLDWQVWIKEGDQPLPLKLMIVDRSDPAAPAYIARLTWNLTPTLTAEDFKFHPAPDAKPIRLTAASQ
ncbi:MAG: DUF2092 domain-containing protein [Phenylobacterium sp.]